MQASITGGKGYIMKFLRRVKTSIRQATEKKKKIVEREIFSRPCRGLPATHHSDIPPQHEQQIIWLMRQRVTASYYFITCRGRKSKQVS